MTKVNVIGRKNALSIFNSRLHETPCARVVVFAIDLFIYLFFPLLVKNLEINSWQKQGSFLVL